MLRHAGVRKARFQQYDDRTLRGGRKGDPQHKCCGNKLKTDLNQYLKVLSQTDIKFEIDVSFYSRVNVQNVFSIDFLWFKGLRPTRQP